LPACAPTRGDVCRDTGLQVRLLLHIGPSNAAALGWVARWQVEVRTLRTAGAPCVEPGLCLCPGYQAPRPAKAQRGLFTWPHSGAACSLPPVVLLVEITALASGKVGLPFVPFGQCIPEDPAPAFGIDAKCCSAQ
jgi:hypothetical protein